MNNWLYKLCFNAVTRPLVWPYWKFGLEGARDAWPKTGGLIVALNHESFMDPYFFAFAFPRDVHYLMTAKWYEKSKLWNVLFRGWGTFPVKEGDAKGTIERVCEQLAAGRVVGIFPEGGISPDGRIRKFRPGLARMAAKSGAPVLPVGIRGSYESLPRSRRVPRPWPVKFHLGEPVSFPGAPMDGPPPRDDSVAFTRRIFTDVCRLAGQEDRVHLIDE